MTVLLILKHLVLIMSVNSHFLEQGYSVTEQTTKPVSLQQFVVVVVHFFGNVTADLSVLQRLLVLVVCQAACPQSVTPLEWCW